MAVPLYLTNNYPQRRDYSDGALVWGVPCAPAGRVRACFCEQEVLQNRRTLVAADRLDAQRKSVAAEASPLQLAFQDGEFASLQVKEGKQKGY